MQARTIYQALSFSLVSWLAGCGGSNQNTGGTGGSGSGGSGGSSSSGAECSAPEVPCGGQCVSTDSHAANCGSCGHDCQGGMCQSGKCQPFSFFSTPGTVPLGIALDATSIYLTALTAKDTGGILKVSKDKGVSMPLVPGLDKEFPGEIAVDDASVFWITLESSGGGVQLGTGKVSSAPKGGGSATVLASALKNPGAIAVDETSLYWIDPDDGTVMKMAKAGGTPTALATGQQQPTHLVIDAKNVYWASGNMLMKMPKTGGTPATLAQVALPNISGIAVDAASVYCVYHDSSGASFGSEVMKVAIEGGKSAPLASGAGLWSSLVVDEANVYWTSRADGSTTKSSLMSVPVAGGTPAVADSGDFPTDLAADATSIYWSSHLVSNMLSGAVRKVVE